MSFPYPIALVTGANRGLGTALVRALLAAGASKVYATARNGAQLAPIVAMDPGRVVPLTLDITDHAQIAAAASAASDVQLLINNAGVLDFAGPLDVTHATIDRNMNTNFTGTFNMTRAFASVIAANKGGNITNVLTFLTYVSAPVFSAYNASKAASWSMAMSLRPYLAAQNIVISNVFPTTIDTEMVAGLNKTKDTPDDVATDIVKGIMAREEDIYPMGAINTFRAWQADQKAVERNFAKIM